jgi:hypothetical protein
LNEARAQLNDIFSAPDYSWKHPTVSGWDWFSFLKQWGGGVSSSLLWMVFWTFLGACAAVILFWLLRHWWIHRAIRARNEEQLQENPDLLCEAEQWARKGDTRQAVRLLYHFVLSVSSMRGKLKLAPAKTNGEYRREMEATWPDKAGTFQALSRKFDEVWYGGDAPACEEVNSYRLNAIQFSEEEGTV